MCEREDTGVEERGDTGVGERETGVREKERDRGGRERKIKAIQGGRKKDRTRDRVGTKREIKK